MRNDIPSPQPSPRKRGEGVSTPLPPAGEGKGERVLLQNAKQLSSNQTDAELKLWDHLRAHRFMGLKFKRQKPVGRYIADFVCIEHKLVIELDGGQHSEQTAYDAERDDWLRSEGFAVLQFWNNEVMQELVSVLEKIRLTLSPDPSPASGRGEQDNPLAPLAGRGLGRGA